MIFITKEQRKLPTVSDLRALKGQKQLTMLRYFSLDEAAAAEAAGIDIASVPAEVLFHPRYREVAPSIFSTAGQTHTECGTPHEYFKWCNSAIERGAEVLFVEVRPKINAHNVLSALRPLLKTR